MLCTFTTHIAHIKIFLWIDIFIAEVVFLMLVTINMSESNYKSNAW